MVDDAVLSREAAYMYQYVTGFQPVNGNLLRWRGLVNDNNGNSAELELVVPDDFPYSPPQLRLPGSTEHPRVRDGMIMTRSIQNWTPSHHLYSVIREAKSILGTGSFQTIQKTSNQKVEQGLESQVSTLRTQLETKKQELASLKKKSSQEVQSSHSVADLIEDSLIEVENESYALEESYDNLEIKAIEFAMNFVDARKRYYLIEAAKGRV